MGRIDLVNPQTDRSPDEGLTVGSMTTESSGASIRAACARPAPSSPPPRPAGWAATPTPSTSSTAPSCGTASPPASTTGPSRRGRPGRRAHRRGVAEAAGAAPDRRHERWPPRPAAQAGSARPTCTTSRFRGLLHARVLRQPGFKAKLASLDEAAIRHAAGAPIEILREGQFVASCPKAKPPCRRRRRGRAKRALEGAAISRRALRDGVAERAALPELPLAGAAGRAVQPPPPHRRLQPPYIAHGSMGRPAAWRSWRTASSRSGPTRRGSIRCGCCWRGSAGWRRRRSR